MHYEWQKSMYGMYVCAMPFEIIIKKKDERGYEKKRKKSFYSYTIRITYHFHSNKSINPTDCKFFFAKKNADSNTIYTFSRSFFFFSLSSNSNEHYLK